MTPKKGIYTLANDTVLDQLIALLNSIECNCVEPIPVIVVPYDNNTTYLKAEVAARSNVALFDDASAIDKWENFALNAWKGLDGKLGLGPYKSREDLYRRGVYHRLVAFDGPFDKFVYVDVDALLLGSLERIFSELSGYDIVTYDYQYKDPSHVYDISNEDIYDVFPEERINNEIFCSGFFAGNKGLFDDARLEFLKEQLNAGDVHILYPRAPMNTILNYMVMKSGVSLLNLGIVLPKEARAGNSVTSKHFEDRGHILYDKGNRLTYLHYIGVPCNIISRVCSGENLDFPYRDIFLYYRFLKDPGNRPVFDGKPAAADKAPGFFQKIAGKILSRR